MLDSEEGGPDFEELYVEAMRQPDEAVERAEALAAELGSARLRHEMELRCLGRARRWTRKPLSDSRAINLPFWTERMTRRLPPEPPRPWVRARNRTTSGIGCSGRTAPICARAAFAPTKEAGAGAPHARGPARPSHRRAAGILRAGSPIPCVLVPEISDKVTRPVVALAHRP